MDNKDLQNISDLHLEKNTVSDRNISGKIFLEIFMVLVAIVFLVPIWMTIINSLKGSFEAATLSLSFPTKLHFENYLTVFRESYAFRGLLNGLFIATTSTLIIVGVTAMAAFYTSRAGTKLAHIMYLIFVSGLILPIALVPTYYLLNILQIRGTYLALILVFSANILPFAVFLFTGFIKTIPRQLDEAALIDGCSQFRVFYQIILPLLQPITTIVVVFSFIWIWNDSMLQLYFADSDKWTMPMTVYAFFGKYTQNWNLVFADVIVTVIPCFILYICLQKYIVTGMTAGAIKG